MISHLIQNTNFQQQTNLTNFKLGFPQLIKSDNYNSEIMIGSQPKLRIRTSVDDVVFPQDQVRTPKAPSQYILGSRRRSVLRDDFTKLCILGTNGWIINKQLYGLLSQSNQLSIIGIIGQVEECTATIETIVKQNIFIYNHEQQGIFISRPFFLNKDWKIPVAFLICTIKSVNPDSTKFQFITSMLSHILIVFDWTSNMQRLNKSREILRNNQRKLDRMLGIHQSLIVFSYQNTKSYQSLNFGVQDSLLQWGVLQIRGKVDISNKEQNIHQFIHHNIKKNFPIISSFLPIGYYYFFNSMWVQLKGSSFKIQCDKLLQHYNQIVEKDVRQQYKNQLQENFQQNKDDNFVYQCLKSLRQLNKNKFQKLTFFCRKESYPYQQRLVKYFNQEEDQIVKRNSQHNYIQNKQIAEECISKLKKSMNYKCYTTKNLHMFSDDFSRFLEQYKTRSIGENSGQSLKHWMSDYNKRIQQYFTDVITNDLSKSVAKSHDQSKDNLIERIALTQGMLSTVQKQLISLERKRQLLEKQSNTKKTKIQNIRKSLRQTKQRLKIDQQKNQWNLRHKTKSVDPKSTMNIQNSNQEIKKKKRWLCFG